MVEYDADTRKVQHARNVQTVEQIGPSVTTRLGQWDLSPRDEDGFTGVGEEEREDGGGIREGVCSGQDDEAFVEIPILGY